MKSTLQTSDLLTSALAAGLVSADEVTQGAAEVRRAALLLRGRPIAYGRRADPDAADDAAGREWRCLRLLADSGLVPDVLQGAADGVVWTAAIGGSRLTELTGTMAELAEACQAWGSALATLHQTRTAAGSEPPVATRPGVLDPDRLPDGRQHRYNLHAASARALVLRTLQGDRGLRRTVDRVADHWTAEHWTHGELTAERVLVQWLPALRVRFVDLRHAGLGNPSWDLAGALETIAELTGGPHARWGRASGACLSEYLLRGYRRAGGTAAIDAGTRALRIVARAWDAAIALDSRSAHPASMHPAAGHPAAAGRLADQLVRARELATRSARPGLVAA